MASMGLCLRAVTTYQSGALGICIDAREPQLRRGEPLRARLATPRVPVQIFAYLYFHVDKKPVRDNAVGCIPPFLPAHVPAPCTQCLISTSSTEMVGKSNNTLQHPFGHEKR